MTGSNYNHKNHNHFNELIKKIESYQLKDHIEYMGILSHNKILNLLYHTTIIINPSLFKRRRTMVEEEKNSNKKILL